MFHFGRDHTLTHSPMMIFSAAPFLGPVLGPLLSGFINANVDWHWTFYVVLIWAAVMLALLLLFVPETYTPELLRRRAVRCVFFQSSLADTNVSMRRETGDDRWVAPVETMNRVFVQALQKSIRTPFGESDRHARMTVLTSQCCSQHSSWSCSWIFGLPLFSVFFTSASGAFPTSCGLNTACENVPCTADVANRSANSKTPAWLS